MTRVGAVPRLTILIPAFNEEAGLGQTLAGLHAEERLRGAEILVVDDGSTDATAAIAQAAGVGLVRHAWNRGYGAAIKTGLRRSSGGLIAWFDADGQHQPADLADMVDRLQAERLDAVLGSRDRGSHVPMDRVVGKAVLQLAAQAIAGIVIPDINCGLRVFRRSVLAACVPLLPDGFSASTTTTLLLLKRRYPIVFHSVRAQPRSGRSTVRPLRDGLRTLHLIIRMVLLFDALRVFSWVAALLGATGLGYGLAVALLRGQGLPVLAGVLILTGVLLFFLGLVSDQVSALRLEQLEALTHLQEEPSPTEHEGESVRDRG